MPRLYNHRRESGRLGLRGVLALACATAAGALGLLSPGAQARAAGGPCGVSRAARTSSTGEPAPRRIGAVRLSDGPGGWLIQAPLRRVPSYVSQSLSPTGQLTLTFCLRAPRRAATRIVQVSDGGVRLALRAGHLRLSVARRGTVWTPRRPRTVTGRPTAVRLAISDDGRRVVASADGQRQATFSGTAASVHLLRIGSLTSSRGGTLRLSNVTISTSPARVVLPSAPRPGSGAASGPPPFVDQPAPWPGNPFSETSVWNAPLAANAPLDSQSQAYVTEIKRQVHDYHPWIETTSYSVPVYVVGPRQSTQHVTLDTWGPDLQAAFDAVPIPSTAQPAAGTDQDMTVWQPSTDRMWDFWGMRKEAGGWHTRWGGEMDDVSRNPGYFTHSGQTANWGATATGLPLLGGLITEADLRRGYINHALAIDLVETDKAYWSWPAQRTDGDYWTPGITPIPEGTRFRLPPTLNIASLNLPPIVRMLARAAQTYGIVVADKGPNVAFFGEDPKSIGSNPWPGEFQDQSPDRVLDTFPWGDLEALKTQLGCCWFVGA